MLKSALRSIHRATKSCLIGLILLYRFLFSPFVGQHCRFYPTCSQYAKTSLQRHGILRGLWLSARRLARCHPWHPGGVDEVPK